MSTQQPRRLAIVDDDEGARSGLVRLLRCLGHDVVAFASAEDFEAAGLDVDVDCLIVDVRLPGSSGPELRDRLRGRGASTPVVFITGDANAKTRDHPRGGAAAMVVKPFDIEALLAAIDAAMAAAAGGASTRHAG
jgi:FixJ family two-component response regulator